MASYRQSIKNARSLKTSCQKKFEEDDQKSESHLQFLHDLPILIRNMIYGGYLTCVLWYLRRHEF
jgi:hypothetical protein